LTRENGGTHTKVDFENRFQLVLLTTHADSATFSIRVSHSAFEFERDAKKKHIERSTHSKSSTNSPESELLLIVVIQNDGDKQLTLTDIWYKSAEEIVAGGLRAIESDDTGENV
jgi:hypothetical protein